MMIKNILIYICIIALGYIFYLLFVGYLSYYVFLVILFCPILSLILLLLMFHQSQLSFIDKKVSIIQQEKSVIKIKKEAPLLGYCRVHIFQSKYLLKNEINEIDIVYPHCGGFRLTLGKYKQYDTLNLFFIKKNSSDYIDVTVLPKSIQYPFDDIASTLPSQEQETYSISQKGDDSTEIFDIHEYHEGDLLKNIHWKLSLKHQKLLIKDNALPIQETISLQCMLYANDDDNDLMFQYLHAFCQYLLLHQYAFTFMNQHIEGQQQYLQALSQLLWTKKDVHNHTKSFYQYLVDKEGVHYIKR